MMDSMFEKNYYTTLTVKVRHEDRILKGDKDFHEVYENVLFYAKSRKFKPLKRHKDNTSIDEYKYTIETSSYDEVMELDGKNVDVFSPEHYRIKKEKTPSANYLKPISIRGSIRVVDFMLVILKLYQILIADIYLKFLIWEMTNMDIDIFGFRQKRVDERMETIIKVSQ